MKHLIIRQIALFILLFFTFSSCGDGEIDNQLETNRVEDKAEYELHISGSDGSTKTLIGENLEGARWDPDLGYVWLSTDLNNEPLGTLTLTIVMDGTKAEGIGIVTGAILSTTDVRVGTGGEINGKSYKQVIVDEESSFVIVTEIGANFIYVENLSIKMEEVSDEPELILLSGWFIAKDE